MDNLSAAFNFPKRSSVAVIISVTPISSVITIPIPASLKTSLSNKYSGIPIRPVDIVEIIKNLRTS